MPDPHAPGTAVEGRAPGRLLGRVVPFGDLAVLAELPDLEQVRRLDAAVRERRRGGGAPWAAVVDQVPAARSVLLTVAAEHELQALAAALARLVADLPGAPARGGTEAGTAGAWTAAAGPSAPVVELPVVYDGEDLEEVAALTGLSTAQVVRRHLAGRYSVAFGGFMPGFAYLTGLDPALRTPRRADPRPRVPAGAVAIADGYTAVYPSATPGGWRLLGRCATTLFDVDRDPPAVLLPGTEVRFVQVEP
ncbi:5-oxoprolinase subunit B family protein [Cellulomonas massiliensis]|uniref:5-oxoprolinase subunit B family protein n=1 Tax=Cellulomonas massiliensis TaxID=1465811 RepID=UPI00030E2C57|nr:allophanate hydrolase subunit 1 [Cellulomonas massiliensis]